MAIASHLYGVIASYEYIKLSVYFLLAVELQNDHNKSQTVGKYHEVHCIFYTGEAASSSDVNISWIGPDGVIANDSSRITVIPTTNDGYIHTSTLQFSYISEEDENTSYNCTASLFGDHEPLSKLFTMTNLTSKCSQKLSCTYAF